MTRRQTISLLNQAESLRMNGSLENYDATFLLMSSILREREPFDSAYIAYKAGFIRGRRFAQNKTRRKAGE